MIGGYQYYDAQTDDARLVLRVIREAVRAGGTALNYACVEGLLRDRTGQVRGVQLRDQVTGATKEVIAPVVINATGAWADRLRAHLNERPRLRPLRGSHLIIPMAQTAADAGGEFPASDRQSPGIRLSVGGRHAASARPMSITARTCRPIRTSPSRNSIT